MKAPEIPTGNVLVLGPIAPRSDEAEFMMGLHNGSETINNAISPDGFHVHVTPTPAPHIPPRIPRDRYSNALHREYAGAELPRRFDAATHLSPQVINWFDLSGKPVDLAGLATLPETVRRNAYISLGQEIAHSSRFCREIGNPDDEVFFWGTWGRYPDSNREKDGLNRGGPTLLNGHIHIIAMPEFASIQSFVQRVPLTPQEQINHSRALESVFMSIFGPHVQKSIEASTGSKVNQESSHFSMSCASPQAPENILAYLGSIASLVGEAYADSRQLHQSLWSGSREAASEIDRVTGKYGLTRRQSESLIGQLQHLHPTLRQVSNGEYDIDLSTHRVYQNPDLIHPTSIPIRDLMSTGGLPSTTVHGKSSCAFGARLDHRAMVTNYVVYPLIQSTESFIEPYYQPEGVILRRPTKQ
jgi:hypothetical protein